MPKLPRGSCSPLNAQLVRFSGCLGTFYRRRLGCALLATRHSAPARVAPHFRGARLGMKSVVVSQLVGGGRLAPSGPSRRSLTTPALRPARTGRPLPAAPQAAAAAPAAAAAVYEVGKGIHLLERSECSGSSSSGCRCLYLHGPPSLGAILPPPLLVRPNVPGPLRCRLCDEKR